jgi:hypothetical protein
MKEWMESILQSTCQHVPIGQLVGVPLFPERPVLKPGYRVMSISTLRV